MAKKNGKTVAKTEATPTIIEPKTSKDKVRISFLRPVGKLMDKAECGGWAGVGYMVLGLTLVIPAALIDISILTAIVVMKFHRDMWKKKVRINGVVALYFTIGVVVATLFVAPTKEVIKTVTAGATAPVDAEGKAPAQK